MNASERHLSERTTGQLPLSVGTSLAIESAIGIHPEIQVNEPPIKHYTEFWVNLKTLYRNMMGSLQADAHNFVLGGAVGEEIRHEMDRIDSIIGDEFNVDVIYYVCNYDHLEQDYPNARIRVDTTPKQKFFTRTMIDALKYIIVSEQPPPHMNMESRVRVFNKTIRPKKSVKTLILTHIPLDLCSAKHFGELTLLESHTGAFKEKAQWYTKYLNGKDLAHIPFREDLLQIFGDHELFSPYPIEQRRELLEVAEKYKWTSLTTLDKMRYSIDQLKNPYFKAKLKAMLIP